MLKDKIVFDLEASCWLNCPQLQKLEMQTIEIGAVRVTDSFEPLDTFQCFVKPWLNPILSDFCKTLTSITQEQVEGAEDFAAAFPKFLSWAGSSKCEFISWGNYDYNQLTQDCKWSSIEMFDKQYHKNGKELYQQYTGKFGQGLGKELNKNKIKFEGTPHRGIDDAINIARLLRAVKK